MRRASTSQNKYNEFLKKPRKNGKKSAEVMETRSESGSPADFSDAESDDSVSDHNQLDTENVAPEKTENVAPEISEHVRSNWGGSCK